MRTDLISYDNKTILISCHTIFNNNYKHQHAEPSIDYAASSSINQPLHPKLFIECEKYLVHISLEKLILFFQSSYKLLGSNSTHLLLLRTYLQKETIIKTLANSVKRERNKNKTDSMPDSFIKATQDNSYGKIT